MGKERPKLSGLVNLQTTPIEEFQNTVIRPIIKMQHHLIIAFFNSYLKKRKVTLLNLTEGNKKLKIKSILQKDLQFKNTLIGSIIGHFSLDEYKIYNQNTTEFNRRIINITIQRLQDSLDEL